MTIIQFQVPALSFPNVSIGNPLTSCHSGEGLNPFVVIKVYDLLGREVKTLVNEYKQPGTYQVSFNAEGLSSGVYFYRIETSNFTSTKKCVLLK